MKKDLNQQLAELNYIYRKNPCLFFKHVLGVELDKQQKQLIKDILDPNINRICIKSGRGTGKTFLVAGLTFWWLICFEDVNIRVISPSYEQLTGVYMREIRKFYNGMTPTYKKFYEIFSDKITLVSGEEKTTSIAKCVTASAEKPETLSGVHSKTQIYLFDEGSAVDAEVYNICLGSLGTAEDGGTVIIISNPTRGSGFFADLFAKKVKGWSLRTFTALDSDQVSEEFIQEQIDLYGEDSDEYRVNILGEFPKADSSVFIPHSLIEEAVTRIADYREYSAQPKIMGVDVARSRSGDSSVIIVRQGNKVLELISFKTEDTMEVVAKVSDVYRMYDVHTIYMDSTGVGGPVADRCRELSLPVVDVVVANKSDDPVQYGNLRTQLWGEMRSWLETADIPDSYELIKELSEMTWVWTNKMAMRLTSKKDLTDSPDHADALSFTLFNSSVSIRRVNVRARVINKKKYLWI